MKEGNRDMKQFSKDDPEFTAMALGEGIETVGTGEISEADLEEFESLKAFAADLEKELKSESSEESMGEERMQRIRESAEQKIESPKRIVRFPVWWSAAAACFTMAAVTSFVVWTQRETPAIFTDRARVETQDEIAPPPPALMERSPDDSDGASPRRPQLSEPMAISKAKEIELLLNPGAGDSRGQGRELNRLGDLALAGASDGAAMEVFLLDDSTVSKDLPLLRNERQEQFRRESDELRKLEVARAQAMKTMTLSQEAPPEFGYVDDRAAETFNREGYERIEEKPFVSPMDSPLSTFSIDVDTAAYANVRRYIENGQLPPADAVRIEELINYFRYDYKQPKGEAPFSVTVDSAAAPWNSANRLVRIGLQGKEVSQAQRPAANLVFLMDVSGSMADANKLSLATDALSLLVDQMGAEDRIAVVVYAGNSGLALPSTTANNKETIKHALKNLRAGGSTNGGSGITLAYDVAQRHFVERGINRVILCTDGDFNVGVSSQGELTRLIEEKAKSGVFFSAVGFGRGNYRDDMMETLSNRGNGNYAYVDREAEARKVFIEDMLGTLLTIAKDVKIQVEFNPSKVASYRLIGYENRALADRDFNDDTKDAGEIGSGHSVTALYEIVPVGGESVGAMVDPLRYQTAGKSVESDELLTVKLRYKLPDEDESSLIEHPFVDDGEGIETASADFRFAAAVAGFGMVLRDSEYTGSFALADVVELARSSIGRNEGGHKLEFVELARKAAVVQPR